jgi:hypothetical protein
MSKEQITFLLSVFNAPGLAIPLSEATLAHETRLALEKMLQDLSSADHDATDV